VDISGAEILVHGPILIKFFTQIPFAAELFFKDQVTLYVNHHISQTTEEITVNLSIILFSVV